MRKEKQKMRVNTNYNNVIPGFTGNTNSANAVNSGGNLANLTGLPIFNRVNYGRNTAARLLPNVQDFLSSAKLSSNQLQSSLNSLLGTTKILSSFSSTPVSSNKDLLTVKSFDNNRNLPNSLHTSIQINQAATTQRNRGTALTAGSSAVASGFTSGAQNMRLSVGDRNFNVGFSVNAGDTNRDVQEKIAESINRQNTGVRAHVEHDSKNNTSTLILESQSAGSDYDGQLRFQLHSLTGNALERTGIGTVSRYAQNALYSINGGPELTSRTNDVDIGNGITVTLKASGTAEVTMGKNHDAPIQDIRNMVRHFNDLLAAAEVNRSDRRTNALYNQLMNTSKSYSASLERVGIEVTAAGYLRIDETKLKSAAESGRLETFITENRDRNFGFANRMQRIAGRVDSNPSAHVTIEYEKAMNTIDLNANQSMRFSRLENIGLFLYMVL
jgi:hypothetical protein